MDATVEGNGPGEAGGPGDGGPPGREPAPAAIVYWRPGCFFCGRLLRGLKRHGVAVDLRNIWTDDEARAFVRGHNGGNETVPTVVVGAEVWTNPDVRTVTEALRAVEARSR